MSFVTGIFKTIYLVQKFLSTILNLETQQFMEMMSHGTNLPLVGTIEAYITRKSTLFVSHTPLIFVCHDSYRLKKKFD